MKKKSVIVSVVALLLVGGFGAWNIVSKNNNDDEILWREYEVKQENIVTYFDATAKVEMDKTDDLAPSYMYVKEVSVKVGDKIAQGDQIAVDKNGVALLSGVDGVITEVHITKNQEIQQKDKVIEVSDFNKRKVKVMVSQEHIESVHLDQKVLLDFVSNPGTEVVGKVASINNNPTEGGATVEYEVWVEMETNELFLLNGMNGSAKFVEKEVNDILTLSNKAIFNEEGVAKVLIRDEKGNIEKRDIETGFSDGRVSEIVKGLQAGDIVVVEG